MLKNGFGFTDKDVNDYLGIDDNPATDDAAFNDQFDEMDVALMFSECGEDMSMYEVVMSQSYTEEDELKLAFAAVDDLKTTQIKITDILKKQPKATDEAIAKALGIGVEKLNPLMADLLTKGVINAERKVIGDIVKHKVPEIIVQIS